MKITCIPYAVSLFLFPLSGTAQSEKVDVEVMKRIRQEGLQNSSVMDIAFQVTELCGPRVTNSSGFMKAANYAKNQLSAWGLVNSRLEPWGEFGKGWELERTYVAINSPWYRPLIAYPKTWSAGTNGAQNGDVLLITAKDSAALDKYQGKLKGKILIIDDLLNFELVAKPGPVRRSDEDLQKLGEANQAEDTAVLRWSRERSAARNGSLRAMLSRLKKLAAEDGAIALLSSAAENNGGTIFIQQGGPYSKNDPANFLDIVIGLEDYNMIVRLLRTNTPVKMEVDVKTKFQTADTKGYNVIAEIAGTDNDLKEEIVMLGAHLDSWPAANGATDNAAGVSAMMEAVRILKVIGVKPRRTIRIALWSGEEQGLLGSQGYVTKTFGDGAAGKLLPAHEKFSVYFNLDYGTGKILGINLQGNEAARSIFQDWFVPFHDLGAKTVTIRNSYATDHVSFDAVGLPGFQFIQDQLRTQHSNMDSYEYLSADDLKQSATIVAAFVYNAAMRDEKIPRKIF